MIDPSSRWMSSPVPAHVRRAFGVTLLLLAAVAVAPLIRVAPPGGVVVIEKFHANGSRSERREYRGGREEGIHRGWYPDGSRRFVYRYENGLMEGVQQAWYPDGRPYTRFEYRAGHEAGRQQMWTDRGVLRANYVIQGNRRFGLMGTTGCMGTTREDRIALADRKAL